MSNYKVTLRALADVMAVLLTLTLSPELVVELIGTIVKGRVS